MIREELRHVIKKAERGDTLIDEELDLLYCEAPDVLRERDNYREGLRAIKDGAHLSAEDLRLIASRFMGV